MGGTYVKTLPGKTGEASLTIRSLQAEPVTIRFTVHYHAFIQKVSDNGGRSRYTGMVSL